MSKLSKEDFDAFLGKESFYSEQDKDRFFNKLNTTPKRKRNWFPQLVSAIAIFGVFYAGFQVIQEGFPFTSSSDQIKETQEYKTVDSKEEVDTYYENMTPGLERAEELGLVTEVDKTDPITEKSSLHIEKIWYNSDEIFVFYSISLPNLDRISEEQAAPQITSFYLQPDNADRFPGQLLDLYTKNMGPREGIIYNNRFYHRATSIQIENKANEPLNQFDGLVTANITVNQFGEKVKVPDVEIPIHYNKKQEPTFSSSINQTIKSQNVTFTFDRIDIGVTKNYLYGKVDGPNDLHQIKGTITTQSGKSQTILGSNPSDDKPNSFVFRIPAFNSIPKKINIDIDSVSFVGDDSFEFSLDVSDYEEKLLISSNEYEENAHKKITEIKNTAIYLNKLFYDERGIDFSIMYEPENPNQAVQLMETIPSTGEFQAKRDLPVLVSAENEKGKPAEFGERGSGPGQQFDLFLAKSFVESSEKVDITIENLLYNVKIEDSISFSISKEE